MLLLTLSEPGRPQTYYLYERSAGSVAIVAVKGPLTSGHLFFACANLLYAFFAPLMYLVFPEIRDSKFLEHGLAGFRVAHARGRPHVVRYSLLRGLRWQNHVVAVSPFAQCPNKNAFT